MPPTTVTARQIDRSELIVGRYRPIRPLGAGGSGQVWLALDEDAGREVALKIVARQGRAAQRAEREAEAVWRLRHPGCARALTLEGDDDNVYLVYEYIPGRTLREALRTRALTDAQVVEVAAQLLDALDHAHQQGVVHRDVKPTNIILEEGPSIRVRLLDFGLALIDDVDALTAAGDVPGTLAYISPERLDGSEATEAADVWSVGLILWEGLCGRHPFFGDSAAETTRRIMAGPGSVADERPELPSALIAAVDGSLSLDPASRPSVTELASSLRAGLQSRRRRSRPQPRRRARLDWRQTAVRASHAALLGAFAAAMLVIFPFFPYSFTLPMTLLVAGAAFVRPRLGLALALAVPVLPLGDVSSGLAIAYACAALIWLIVYWRAPLAGAAFVLGPLLASVGLLGLLAVVGVRVVGPARRAGIVVGGVAAAAAFAALRDLPLPFVDAATPAGLGIRTSDDPVAVLSALATYAWSQPALLALTGVLALAAAFAPLGLRATVWQLSLVGSLLVATMLLLPTLAFDVDVGPGELVVAAAVGIAFLGTPALGKLRETIEGRDGAAPRSPGRFERRIGRIGAALTALTTRIGRRTGSRQLDPTPATLGPVVTDPVSLEEAWSHVIDGVAAPDQDRRIDESDQPLAGHVSVPQADSDR